MDKNRDPFACAVIAELGGTAATSRLFKIRMPSVSGWKETGLPDARLMYLEVAYPEVLEKVRAQLRESAEPSGIDSEDDVQPPVGTPPEHE